MQPFGMTVWDEIYVGYPFGTSDPSGTCIRYGYQSIKEMDYSSISRIIDLKYCIHVEYIGVCVEQGYQSRISILDLRLGCRIYVGRPSSMSIWHVRPGYQYGKSVENSHRGYGYPSVIPIRDIQ